jgi:hypothetical protein
VTLAVTLVAVPTLLVPPQAQAFSAAQHHKAGHDHGPPDAPESDDELTVTLEASADQVEPGTAVQLTATANAAITGGTWMVRDADGEWRDLESWTLPNSQATTARAEVQGLRREGERVYKVRVTSADGAVAADRVKVRTVREGTTDRFKAVTWNVYYGTPVDELRPILRRLLADGVSVFLMQEMSNPDARRMLEQEGLAVHYVGYQWVVAWDPDLWSAAELRGKRLSSTSFTRLDGTGPVYVDSAHGVLEDREGRTLEVMSYHLPPNVQQRNPERNRLRIDRDAAANWRRLVEASTADAMLFGGDDNVDEVNGYRTDGDFWDFLRRPATGLRQLQAPTGTVGKNRRIDDFRIRGLKPGAGYTARGGGDHKLFVSSFTWR